MKSKPLWTKADIYEMIRVAESEFVPCEDSVQSLKNLLATKRNLKQLIQRHSYTFWSAAYWWGYTVLDQSYSEAAYYATDLMRAIGENS